MVARILSIVLLATLAGCQTADCIHAGAVDATFRRVADRHDAYVNADATRTDVDKRVALRDTALLRTLLDGAERASTQPSK